MTYRQDFSSAETVGVVGANEVGCAALSLSLKGLLEDLSVDLLKVVNGD